MSDKTYHYTYRIHIGNPTDARRFYVGVRSCKCWPTEDSTYFGSSIPLKKWIKENGSDGVSKEILAVWGTRKLAVEHEVRLHEHLNVVADESYFNIAKQTCTGFDVTGTKQSEEHRRKKADALRGRTISDEQRRQHSEKMKGRKHSPERIEQTRQLRIGKKHSEETKRKISLSNMGKTYSEQSIANMIAGAKMREQKKREARQNVY